MDQFENVTNAELLTALAGRTAAESLQKRYSRLTELAQASFDDLRGVKGIGRSRAAAVRAAFLLAKRLTRETYPDSPLLDTPERIADLLREENRTYMVENFQVILLNTRRRLIGVQNVSQGTLDTILVHPREVFAAAIAKRASAIVLAHNHPSGDPTPSEADIKVTRDLVRAGQLIRIDVLDHIIFGQRTPERVRDFVSLRELGYLSS